MEWLYNKLNKANKGTYINFYFRQKKVALHRLLYINYIGDLSNEEYLKLKVITRVCCNANHLKKFKYNKTPKKPSNEKSQRKNQKHFMRIHDNNEASELVVDFL